MTFDLSEKIIDNADDLMTESVVLIEDVKEFIRLLKEFEYWKTMGGDESEHLLISKDDLDKLAGEKLI